MGREAGAYSDCLTLPRLTASKHFKSMSVEPGLHFVCRGWYARGLSAGMLGLHASFIHVCCGSHSHVQSYLSFCVRATLSLLASSSIDEYNWKTQAAI